MQIGLFAQARSALPFNVTTGVDNNRDTTINERPDLANPDGDPRWRSTYNAQLHRPRRQSAAQLRAWDALLRSAPARVEDDRPRTARGLDRVELFVEVLLLTICELDPQGVFPPSRFG